MINIERIIMLSQNVIDTLIASSNHDQVEEKEIAKVLTDFIEDEMSDEGRKIIFDELDYYEHTWSYDDLVAENERLENIIANGVKND
jgi:hypothetical protein